MSVPFSDLRDDQWIEWNYEWFRPTDVGKIVLLTKNRRHVVASVRKLTDEHGTRYEVNIEGEWTSAETGASLNILAWRPYRPPEFPSDVMSLEDMRHVYASHGGK